MSPHVARLAPRRLRLLAVVRQHLLALQSGRLRVPTSQELQLLLHSFWQGVFYFVLDFLANGTEAYLGWQGFQTLPNAQAGLITNGWFGCLRTKSP